MNIIKANYNNAYVKRPKKLIPGFFVYAMPDENNKRILIIVDSKLDQESFYDDYKFEIKVDDTIIAYATKSSGTSFELDLSMFEGQINVTNSITITVDGYYTNNYNKAYEINTITLTYDLSIVCEEELVCSEDLYIDNVE